jgi:predicted RNA-binding protein associated with RNAse of E/G family
VAAPELTRVRVYLVAHDGILEYEARVLADDGNHLIVEAAFAGGANRDLGFVVFEVGDTWTEHYWRDRWCSIKAVRSASGALKGWYCDAAWPTEVADGVVLTVDLELDLWVSADRRTILRLDGDEFAAFGVPQQFPEAANAAIAAMDECEKLARRGAPPFA